MSKRIMNEPMCLAEDIGAMIYYQDTDSMHIETTKLKILEDEYRKLYNRELMDEEELGKFNGDFKIKEDGDSVAIESYYLGKKSYLDVLRSKDGETAIQTRMKGVPRACITNPLERYKRLFDGKAESFDLTKACPISINNKTQTVSKRGEFIRTVKFV
ncbi:hypothetical protein PHYSODRAFT_534252 [Phytophthora sojae]|uniref:DNA-directed DNA polymerase n=1 Tax=Phytophthora sojae (strain P6497) TaxID=1094619 RepID=G5AGI6_PHYSP|nr:hypothetical protein PHYSODRAFT_534252 [Phytophthora sojae]EGZ05266.1 hypothetical protein PHYSODRAFT_534252 [Phytophthora sojae]|eukprot:XP_009539187.1 hypothetical protein PHYSODRAFT_534252 [Phytophthora sojae]